MSLDKDKVFQQVLEDFLTKSPEELHRIDNDPRYDGGLFATLQDVSDAHEVILLQKQLDLITEKYADVVRCKQCPLFYECTDIEQIDPDPVFCAMALKAWAAKTITETYHEPL